jgi:uncharacterized protein (DUF952 family)
MHRIMPRILGRAVTVVDDQHVGLTIEEFAGGVATNDDVISIARVTYRKPMTTEPWRTLLTDERMCILQGTVEFHFFKDHDTTTGDTPQVLTATAGDTVLISKGERYRPVFPQGNTIYIPVCLPAFTPDRCLREDDDPCITEKDTTTTTTVTTSAATTTTTAAQAKPTVTDDDNDDKIYHMCQKSLWEEAVIAGNAYYPPTFEQDGFFTHATAVPGRLLLMANHFYKNVPGDWICIELNHIVLQQKAGIITKFEQAKPVGLTRPPSTAATNNNSNKEEEETETSFWIYPHIFGGIPSHIDGVVTNIFPMKRDENGSYLSIVGLITN